MLSKKKVAIIVIITVIVVSVGVLADVDSLSLSVLYNKWIATNDEYLPLTEDELALARDVQLTREYKMRLYPERFEKRNDGIRSLDKSIAKILEIDELVLPGNETIRFQVSYDSSVCGSSLSVRMKRFFTGYLANTTYIDIKSVEHGDYKWDVSPQYENDSEKRSETEIHPCKVKKSIDSSVKVPFDTELHTCQDILNIFPSAKNFLDPTKLDTVLPKATDYEGWWWESTHEGILPQDGTTVYYTAVSLQYATLKEAQQNTAPNGLSSPAWAFRIWSSDNGHGRWTKGTTEYLDTKFRLLHATIPTPDIPCTNEVVNVYGTAKNV